MHKIGKNILLTVITAFAGITLFLSSSVIFDWFGIREKEGNYVLFVVWANFLSSILYLISAWGLLKSKSWTARPLIASVVILVVAQIGLFVHINAGELYETKTVGAMFFRITLTLGFVLLSKLALRKKNNHKPKQNH